MIEIIISNNLPYTPDRVFEQLNTISELAKIKKELGGHHIARDEPGLQIIDNIFWVGFLKINSRLTFTTLSGNICELKQLKGRFKEYRCTYTVQNHNGSAELEINLRIKLPYGPLGFLLSILVKPFYTFRLNGEFKKLKRLLDEKAEGQW